MFDEGIVDINQPVTMPLPDGTVVTLTARAKHGLTESGHKLRVKKAGEYVYITFRPSAGWLASFVTEGTPEHLLPTRELNLRDWLAFEMYHLAPSFTGKWFDAEEGGRDFWRGTITLADGNPRNLMPENFRLVWNEPVFKKNGLAPEATAENAAAAVAEEQAIDAAEEDIQDEKVSTVINSPAVIEKQREWLGQHFETLCSNARGILNAASKHQATEVAAETAMQLLSQITNGTCPETEEFGFISWMRGAVVNASKRKRAAIRCGACKDIDHDPSAIRVLKVIRHNAKRLRGGDGNGDDLEDSPMNRLQDLPVGKTFADIEREEAEERARIKEEGGVWKQSHVDLESGAELLDCEVLVVSEADEDAEEKFAA